MNLKDPVPPMQRLREEARIKGVSRMIADGTAPQSVTEEVAWKVIDQITQYKSEHPRISNATIARAIGYGNSVISQVLRMKYPGDWRSIIIDLDRWLEAQKKRDAAPQVEHFVLTKVAEEIYDVANAAITLRRIGLVYGPKTSGIGKTLALRSLALDKPASLLVTIRETAANVKGLLEAISRELRISDEGTSDAKFKRIVAALRGTPRLLIIDQIHNLCGSWRDRPFYVLADLWDEAGNPQLWCGTDDLVTYLDRRQGRGEESMAQIRRRIAIRRDLLERTRREGGGGEPLFTIEEIRKIYGQGKMRLAPDAAQYLHRLACLPDSGALGTCSTIVTLAVALYEPKGENVITAKMVRDVHRELSGWRSHAVLEQEIAMEPKRMAAGG